MAPRSLVLCAFVGTLIPLGSACYVEEEPHADYADRYAPQFYDGYVVYYDDGGRPYYYADGSVIWVPATSPRYVGLVNHWRLFGPEYHRWYTHYGDRFRSFRAEAHRR